MLRINVQVTSVLFVWLIASCGFDSSTSHIFKDTKKFTVSLHNLGHIDFPGFLGRRLMQRDVVQLMLATANENGTHSCQIIRPNIADDQLQISDDLVDEKNQGGWSHRAWSPVISFWRIESLKNKKYFRDSIPDLFEGLTLTKDMLIPRPKHFGFMTKDHRNKVRLTFPEIVGVPDSQLAIHLDAGSGNTLSFIVEPVYKSGLCQVEIQYWCSPKKAAFCADASNYRQRKPFDPERGIGIVTGLTSNTLGVSEIAKDLQVSSFTTKPIHYQTDSID